MKDNAVLIAIDDEELAGAIVGVVFMILMGWLPFIGPIVAGFISGISIRTPRSGLKLGIIVGAIGSILTNFVLKSVFDSITISITAKNSFGMLVSNGFSISQTLNPLLLVAVSLVFAAIGGAIGGAVIEKISRENYKKGVEAEKALKTIKK
ncbi:MAG: DUF5518 domain-containing protein [Candidatus Micrarchaeota archaeon]|nr:DUF5518 domain-containing protein [Candidatus Micrarchaeota archaeon]